MKAWKDIEDDPHRSIYLTSYSQWYLEHGVKIERFNDGRVSIKNTMISPDRYRDVTPDQYQIFEADGWEIGAFKVCYDTYKAKIDRLNAKIRSATNSNRVKDLEDLKNRREELLIKLGVYDNRLNKLLIDL
jgi:hypothetical protein